MKTKAELSHKKFTGPDGETEHFLYIKAPAGLDFKGQLKAVEAGCAGAAKALGLDFRSAVFCRVFLSDILNQADLVRKSGLLGAAGKNPVAVSLVQQAPLSGQKISLLAYFIKGAAPLVKRRVAKNHVLVERGGARHLWSTGLCAGGAASAQEQTRRIFGGLTRVLKAQGGTLRDNCVRTWLYLKNVDVFYQGMVDARRELFAREGLTAKTHYIASTGIEGACGGQFDLVALDAYSVLGLGPAQVSYLNDFKRLCPTKAYNVTFERGTRIAYADRAHCFISGTASIDAAGRTLHPGDVLRQLARACANVAALLKAGRAETADLMYLIVYLRDPADFPAVEKYLKAKFRNLPLAIVQGAVCRPGWLVEIEGLAVTRNSEPALPSF
jgi:enamine deaminase RidA (YjgF/YER057c/UK114 family)